MSSLSFDVVTTATTTNAAPADNAEAPSKDEEEATDGFSLNTITP